MSSPLDGFSPKYKVTKHDGSPVEPGAKYLVLRIDGKAPWSAEAKALAQYLRACDPALADHLRRFYGRGRRAEDSQ